ncbi:MAG: hypothetical protein JXA78_05985 [Anaerolineales bacterium]|nr:hypothetical protein [Anaerolineales bacterium]
MPEPKTLSFDWALWFQWIMATTVGWILGRFVFPNLALVVIGIGIGVLQWFVLQHRIQKAWRWIPATVLGWLVGTAVILFLVQDGMEFFAGVVVGLTTGTAQWFILRREVHWSAWWIAISIVGWTTGMALLPGVILTGVMAGVVTGVALELLMRYPKPIAR